MSTLKDLISFFKQIPFEQRHTILFSLVTLQNPSG